MPRLNFDKFHPLDHHAFSVRCAGYYGGFRQHVYLWLAYQWQWPWERVWHKIECRRGLHDNVTFYRGIPEWDEENEMPANPPAGMTCRWCDWKVEYR